MDINKYFPDGYPLTIERLQFMQDALLKGVSQLTKIAGSGNLIIEGVVNSGSNLSAGTIVIDGEIIDFEASPLTSQIRIFETETNVPYNIDADGDGNLDEKPADTVRVARSATSGGVKTVSYNSFKRVGQLTGAQLPVGSIIPFEGNDDDIPEGWVLYDLSNTFLMGAGGTHSVGGQGGQNSYNIQRSNLPNFNMSGTTSFGGSHQHPFQNYYYIESFPSPNDVLSGYGSTQVGNNFRGSSSTDSDNTHIWYRNRNTSSAGSHSHTFSVNSGGSGAAIDNRPQFRAVKFIKRVSI